MDALIFRSGPVSRAVARWLGPAAPSPWRRLLPGLRTGSVPEPRLPGDGWVRLKVLRSAVAPGDLALLRHRLSGRDLPEGPVVPGAEILAEVVELRRAVHGLAIGDRVVVDPWLSCRARGWAAEPCGPCRAGWPARCERAHEPTPRRDRNELPGPGSRLGLHPQLPGGWTTGCAAHAEQVRRVPGSLSPRAALLTLSMARVLPAVRWLLDSGPSGAWWVGGDPAETLAACALLAGAGLRGGVTVEAGASVEEGVRALGLRPEDPGPEGFTKALLASAREEVWAARSGELAQEARVAWVSETPAPTPRRTESGIQVRRWPGHGWRPWGAFGGEGGSDRAGEEETTDPGDLARAQALLLRAPPVLEEVVTHVYALDDHRRALDAAEGRAGAEVGRVALHPDAG